LQGSFGLAAADKGLALKTGGRVSSVLMGTPATKSSEPRWLPWVALAVCAVAVWAVFGGARNFSFVLWDDDHNIQQNSHLSGVTWENLRWMFTDTGYARRYIPLAWLGWNVDRDLFGLTARSAHLGNVLFHLLNTGLVFLVIQAGLRFWRVGENESNNWPSTVAATLGALLWTLHPLRVEVVAWSSGRIYAQSACFFLISLWCFLKSSEFAPGSTRARRLRWGSVLALALSLLTYPLALGFVGVLLVLEWYRPGRLAAAPGTSRSRQLRLLLADKIPYLAVTAAILGLTLWARLNVQAVGWKPPVTLADFGAVPRFLQACYIWAYYFWKPLLPFNLSPFYTQLISFRADDPAFVASLLAVGLITVGLCWQRRRWPGLWVLWLCHLLVLAPVLGLTEHPHFANDRYSYLAAVPWVVALAVVLVRLWPRAKLRAALVVAVSAAIIATGALSVTQAAVWRNTETLGRHMLAQLGDHPRRFEIYGRMAAALRAEGKFPEANAYFIKSLGGDPTAADKAMDQARQLEQQGRPGEAFVQYRIASQLRPELAEPLLRMGAMLLADHHAAEAVPFLTEAVRLQPDLADAQIKLGWALAQSNQAAEAITHYEAALRLKPSDPAAQTGLGVALAMGGRPQEAILQFEEVIRRFPNSPAAHFDLGLVLLDGLGRADDAAAQFEIVLQLRPDYPGAREALARCKR
jgi:tetratricopeptide (TPR) repeat protein